MQTDSPLYNHNNKLTLKIKIIVVLSFVYWERWYSNIKGYNICKLKAYRCILLLEFQVVTLAYVDSSSTWPVKIV